MAEIWLFEVLGVPGGPKISNPRKTQNIGPRAKIFGILEYLPKGYLCTKNEQNLFFEGFQFVHFEMESPNSRLLWSDTRVKSKQPKLGVCSGLTEILQLFTKKHNIYTKYKNN